MAKSNENEQQLKARLEEGASHIKQASDTWDHAVRSERERIAAALSKLPVRTLTTYGGDVVQCVALEDIEALKASLVKP